MKTLWYAVLATVLALNSLMAFEKPGPSQRFPFGGYTSTTATGNITLAPGNSTCVQRIDPNGSNRDVTLPAVADGHGLYYWIKNTGTANNLVIKDSAGSTVATVTPGYMCLVVGSGTAWAAQQAASESVTAATVTTLTATTVNATDIDAGASGTAGSLDVFPSTASKGKLRVVAADNTGNTTTTITNAAMGQASTITIPDPGAASGTFFLAEGASTVTGNKTFSGNLTRASQRYCFGIGGAKVGGTAGFVVNAADNIYAATCPASQTGAKLIVPIPHVKSGWTITGFGLCGQIESAGGAVTVDCDLRKSTAAAADFTDASVSTMTQISVTADTKIDSTQDKTGLSQAVAQDESYYLVITVTTAGSTDVDIRGVRLIVTEN